jgi:hypothetical protein
MERPTDNPLMKPPEKPKRKSRNPKTDKPPTRRTLNKLSTGRHSQTLQRAGVTNSKLRNGELRSLEDLID